MNDLGVQFGAIDIAGGLWFKQRYRLVSLSCISANQCASAARECIDIYGAPALILQHLGVEIQIAFKRLQLLFCPGTDDRNVRHYRAPTFVSGN